MKRLSILYFVLLFTACSTSEPEPRLSPLTQNGIILAFGDSLTFGTGAKSETESYPAVLQQLTGRSVVNAGIPGEISAAGLKRLPNVLAEVKPALVILCHGGNDILRRLDKTQLANNLEQMVQLIKASGADVVLVGVPTFGFGLVIPDLYPQLAEKYQLANDMEILAELVSQPSLKSDQIHPNSKGYDLFGQQIHVLLTKAGAI
jgi:lysophospholipase L1-like esterase